MQKEPKRPRYDGAHKSRGQIFLGGEDIHCTVFPGKNSKLRCKALRDMHLIGTRNKTPAGKKKRRKSCGLIFKQQHGRQKIPVMILQPDMTQPKIPRAAGCGTAGGQRVGTAAVSR